MQEASITAFVKILQLQNLRHYKDTWQQGKGSNFRDFWLTFRAYLEGSADITTSMQWLKYSQIPRLGDLSGTTLVVLVAIK